MGWMKYDEFTPVLDCNISLAQMINVLNAWDMLWNIKDECCAAVFRHQQTTKKAFPWAAKLWEEVRDGYISYGTA